MAVKYREEQAALFCPACASHGNKQPVLVALELVEYIPWVAREGVGEDNYSDCRDHARYKYMCPRQKCRFGEIHVSQPMERRPEE